MRTITRWSTETLFVECLGVSIADAGSSVASAQTVAASLDASVVDTTPTLGKSFCFSEASRELCEGVDRGCLGVSFASLGGVAS